MLNNQSAGVPRNINDRSNGVTVLPMLSASTLDTAISRIRGVLDALLALSKVLHGYGQMWSGCLRPWFDGFVPA